MISGAFGEFTVSKDTQHPLAFISAGIGITPIVAMLQDLVKQKSLAQITVLHACNSTDDLALWKEVQALIVQLPVASSQLFLNQASEVECTEFKAVKGQMHFESLARGDLKQTSVYMCGPGGFMQFAQDKLVAIGLSENHIHREVFASPNAASGRASPAPAEGPFQVKFSRENFTVTWQPELGSLLDLAELHGLKPSANCRSGACNACRQTVTSGKVFHTLEPAMPQPEQTCLMCCAVPVSDMVIDI